MATGARIGLVVMIGMVGAACGKKKAEPAAVPVAVIDAAWAVDVALADAAAAGADAADPAPPPTLPATLEWKFEALPPTMTKRESAKARWRISVTNHGTEVFDPARVGYQFTLDGETSMQLDLAFGNGGYDESWSVLQPGATNINERGGLDLLELGTHEVVMSSGGTELARTKVTITK